MLETSPEATWLTRELPDCLRAAKEYVYNVENLCSTTDESSKIFHWVRASPEVINRFLDEIERVYKVCLDKGQTRTEREHRREEPDQILPSEILPSLRDLPYQDWRSLPGGKFRNENTKRIYSISGWDTKQVGPARLASKLGLSKAVDAWIFLAPQFSTKTIDQFGNREDLAMINLSNKAIFGGLPSDDNLLRELMKRIESYESSPDRVRHSPSSHGPDKVDTEIAAAGVRESARVFRQHFRLSDCGHLQLDFYGREHLGMYGSEPVSWLRRPTIEEKLEPYPSLHYDEKDPRKILSDMEGYKNYLTNKFREALTSNSLVPIIKSDMAGKLELDEVRILCKACNQDFLEMYEFPEEPPFRGLQFAFKAFVARTAKELQGTEDYNETFDVGVIVTPHGNIVLMMDPTNQPAANIAIFNPSLLVVVSNFFWGRWRERRQFVGHLMGYGFWGEGREFGPWTNGRRTPEDAKVAAFKAVSSYLVPCLAFDCHTERYEHMEIKPVPANLESIVESIASIELTVKPTEKEFKAAHDRLLEELKAKGLTFGYDTRAEYPIGPDRLDVAWVNRTTQGVEVAIEVELRSNPTGELWKLVELKPRLAVLAVKGRQYDQTLMRVAKSRILRDQDQTLMVLDVSDRRSVVIRGNEIVKTPLPQAPS